jgi:hypothetical protein
MLQATCHCGSVTIQIPRRPTEVTNCNCSICRRLGTLWGYYKTGSVKVIGHPERTHTYSHGPQNLQVVRCKTCGCTTHWEPLPGKGHGRLGVNMRNFEPADLGPVRIRLLDGADTWRTFTWDELA